MKSMILLGKYVDSMLLRSCIYNLSFIGCVQGPQKVGSLDFGSNLSMIVLCFLLHFFKWMLKQPKNFEIVHLIRSCGEN